jgi:isoleucyl-tRNA synthetase
MPAPASGGKRAESVLLETWAQLPQGSGSRPHIDWDAIFALRSSVARELEKLRNSGAIGAPLDAEVDIYCTPSLAKTLQPFGEELRFVFITSGARVHAAEQRPTTAVASEEGERNTAWITVQASSAAKCVRCREKRVDVGGNAGHPELCGRCVINLEEPGAPRSFV